MESKTKNQTESDLKKALKRSQYNVFFEVKGKKTYALFNTLTRAILAVDQELKDVLEKGDVNILEPDIKNALSQMGVIVDRNMDEKKIYEFRHNVAKYALEDSCFVIFPTYDCNLRCPYCYEGVEKPSTFMDDAVIENTIEFVKRTTVENRSKIVVVGFYGGEPLLYPHVCHTIADSLSEWAAQNGILYYGTLTTNGTLLTERIAELLFPYTASVHITLDGSEEGHNQMRVYRNGKGSYREVMRAIELVKNTPKHLTLRIHVDTEDESYRGIEVLDDLEQMGLKGRENLHIYFKQLEPPDVCLSADPSEEYIQKKERELNEFPRVWEVARQKGWGPHMSVEPGSEHGILTFNVVPCDHLKRGRYVIDPLGDVYLCPMSAGFKHHALGTLKPGGILDQSPLYYTLLTRNPLQLEGCSDCVYLPMCSGGCPISIFEKTQSYTVSFCGFSKRLKIQAIKSHLRHTYPEKFSEVM
jgi:uncharacterized protein